MTINANKLQEFKSSFGVNSEVPEPVATSELGKPGAVKKDPLEASASTPEITAVGSNQQDTLKPKSKPIKEEVEAMFEGSNLDEEFISKAVTIFEAAVNEKAEEFKAQLREESEAELDEAVSSIVEDLNHKVTSYLNYVVEQWFEENRVGIESNVRTEIAESFIENLKAVFVEHYIEVPESAVDVVEALADEVEALETKLNEAIESNIQLSEDGMAVAKELALLKLSEGLTATQADKLSKLSESVNVSSVEEFETAIATLKESYLVNAKAPVDGVQQLSEEVNVVTEDNTIVSNDPHVNAVAAAMSKQFKNR